MKKWRNTTTRIMCLAVSVRLTKQQRRKGTRIIMTMEALSSQGGKWDFKHVAEIIRFYRSIYIALKIIIKNRQNC